MSEGGVFERDGEFRQLGAPWIKIECSAVKDSDVEVLDLSAKTGASDEAYLFLGKRRVAATT